MFLENKYTRWYLKIIRAAKARFAEGYVEAHHIIPQSMGGSDAPDNIVLLTAREHFIVHLLLPKMVADTKHLRAMRFALSMMRFGTAKMKRYQPKGSKIYEIARRAKSQAQIGAKASAETIAKMSASRRGKRQPPSVGIAMSAFRTGKPLSADHRAAVSKGLTGKKRGPMPEKQKLAIAAGVAKARASKARTTLNSSVMETEA